MSELLKRLRRWGSRNELDEDEPIYVCPCPNDVTLSAGDVTGEYQSLESMEEATSKQGKELEELAKTYCFIPPDILQQL